MSSLSSEVYFGPDGGPRWQWTTLRAAGCIEDVDCFKEDNAILERNIVFAPAGTRMEGHEWCVAKATGRCDNVTQADVDKQADSRAATDCPGGERLKHGCALWGIGFPWCSGRAS